MKRFTYVAVMALTAGLFVVAPAGASSHEDGEKKFSIHGEVRTRWEYIENFMDFQDHDDSDTFEADALDFWAYRVRIGATGQFSKNVTGHVEFQAEDHFGDTFGTMLAGDSPVDQFDTSDNEDIQLYQGWLQIGNIGGSNWSLRVGRSEHTYGSELMLGDNDFYNGQYFEGARGMLDGENFDLDLFYYRIADLDASSFPTFNTDDNVELYGVTFDFVVADNHDIEPYLLFLRDGSDFWTGPGGAVEGFRTYTLGARYSNSADYSGLLDWNVEAAFQSGEIDPNGADLDHSGSILEAWIGFNLGSDRNHRIAIGGFVSSGDDDDTDNDVDGFLTLFPDTHANNRLGDLDAFSMGGAAAGSLFGDFNGFGQSTDGDLNRQGQNLGGISNLTDINVSYTYTGEDGRHVFMVALHQLSLTEEDADFNMEDEIGMEIDLKYTYNYSGNLAFQVGVANLMAGDLLDAYAQDEFGQDADDVMRAWGQIRLRW